MNNIEKFRAQLLALKTTVKTNVADAKAKASKGHKVPVGQFTQETLNRSIAKQGMETLGQLGWVPCSINVSKTLRTASVTYRQPMTLADREARYAQTVANRKAVMAARKAAKAPEVAKAPAVAEILIPQISLG